MYGPKIDAVAKNVIVKVMKLRRQGQLGQGIAAVKGLKGDGGYGVRDMDFLKIFALRKPIAVNSAGPFHNAV